MKKAFLGYKLFMVNLASKLTMIFFGKHRNIFKLGILINRYFLYKSAKLFVAEKFLISEFFTKLVFPLKSPVWHYQAK